MNILSTLCLTIAVAGVTAPAHAETLFSNLLKPPAIFGSGAARPDGRQVVPVQSGDATFRIGQLEEQIRALNGRIEELGFQLLQMQEQMRQMQEDNEFRFQELEKNGSRRSDAGPAVTEPTTRQADNGVPGVEDTTTGSTSQTLGSLTFDQNGNLEGNGSGVSAGQGQSAALNTPDDLYQAGYNYMLAGDYLLAEQTFRDYADVYPDGGQAADAMFWMGEAQYSQAKFTESAKTFLDAHKRYPQAEKGPDTLLKLGMSLAALKKRDTACSTYREVLIRYPGASKAVRKKVSDEQVKASC